MGKTYRAQKRRRAGRRSKVREMARGGPRLKVKKKRPRFHAGFLPAIEKKGQFFEERGRGLSNKKRTLYL